MPRRTCPGERISGSFRVVIRSESFSAAVARFGRIRYTEGVADPPPEGRCFVVSTIVTFALSVAAGVVSYYICKWLDGKKRPQRQPAVRSAAGFSGNDKSPHGRRHLPWGLSFWCFVITLLSRVIDHYENTTSLRALQGELWRKEIRSARSLPFPLSLCYNGLTALTLPPAAPER